MCVYGQMIQPLFRILWNLAITVGPMLGQSRQIILYRQSNPKLIAE